MKNILLSFTINNASHFPVEGYQAYTFFKYVSIVLFLLLIIFIIITFFQLKKINRNKAEMLEKNEELIILIENLRTLNERLYESNVIKEKYIGYYFNFSAQYIDKIDEIRNTTLKYLNDKKIDLAIYFLGKVDGKKEREELFANFDETFLGLFPHFVEEFNLLFEEKDRIVLENDKLLNNDIRIFALIRMGVTDIGKIAKFLNFSINTISTYKTKIKNRSFVPNEIFEDKIMQIK